MVQRVPEHNCGITLIYTSENNKVVYIKPLDDNELPLGQYSLSQEEEQLNNILKKYGNSVVLVIIENYLPSLNKKFTIDYWYVIK